MLPNVWLLQAKENKEQGRIRKMGQDFLAIQNGLSKGLPASKCQKAMLADLNKKIKHT